jgi:hypothetical protein
MPGSVASGTLYQLPGTEKSGMKNRQLKKKKPISFLECRPRSSAGLIIPQNVQPSNPVLVNDQLDALFSGDFISRLYMFQATSAHHQEDQIVTVLCAGRYTRQSVTH